MTDLTYLLILYFGDDQVPFIDALLREMMAEYSDISFFREPAPKDFVKYSILFTSVMQAYQFGNRQATRQDLVWSSLQTNNEL